MSNPDSFIEEVTEEVRRDRLFALLRRYGWIGIVAVLALVGGAAWNEWQKAQATARAQGFGDAVLAALEVPDAADRRAALAAIPATGAQSALRDLMLASDPAADRAGALAALAAVAADPALPQLYRDLADLRRVVVAGSDMDIAARRSILDPLATPGRAFRPLASEQLAYLSIEVGETADALARLSALRSDQEAPAGLRRRAEQMIAALGGAPADG